MTSHTSYAACMSPEQDFNYLERKVLEVEVSLNDIHILYVCAVRLRGYLVGGGDRVVLSTCREFDLNYIMPFKTFDFMLFVYKHFSPFKQFIFPKYYIRAFRDALYSYFKHAQSQFGRNNAHLNSIEYDFQSKNFKIKCFKDPS